MNVFTTPAKIVITCNKRLTPYLEQEVVALGYTPVYVFQTGLEMKGTMNDCIRLNLHLRCASQVLYSLHSFPVDSPNELYDVVFAYPWEDLIANEGYVSITSNVDHFTVNTNLFTNVKVKDAIADRFRRNTGKRPDSGPSLDHSVIHLYWKNSEGELFIDSSGETLAKHGYRKIPGKAPMLEALAAATIMASKWDRQSPFINPMCGSSTLAIEAAMLATNRVPGLYRDNYAFMHILGYDPAVYQEELGKIRAQVKEVPGLLIIATDIRRDAIEVSQVNAEIAGVDHLIRFDIGDFEKTEVPETGGGVVFFNPEYGERLGDINELEATYARIGDFLKKKCKGYTGYIFTGNMDLAKKIGLKAKRRLEFYNAKIDCRLLEYELYAGSREKPREEKKAESEG